MAYNQLRQPVTLVDNAGQPLIVVTVLMFAQPYNFVLMRVFFILMMTMGAITFQASAQTDGKTQEVVIKTEIYCSHCGHCATCRPQIEDALFAITGVKQAKLNIAEQTIKVTFNPKKTTEEAITQAILSNGYSANGLQPTPEAHAKLEDCCQKP